MKRALLSLLTLVVAAGCTERPTSVSERPASKVSQADIASQGDYVATPAGLYHRSCVHEVPEGARIDAGRRVRRKDGTSYQLQPCLYAAYPDWPGAARGAAALLGPTNRGPAVLGPTNNGWIEYAWTSQSAWYQSLVADWRVPAAPLGSYSAQQLYYSFPGLESDTYIIQPVIQYGYNGEFGGSYWTMASWHCNDGSNCTHGPVHNINAGDLMHGSVIPTNCSGGNCTWTITAQDLTLGIQSSYSYVDTQQFAWATGGAVEVKGLTSCSQYPVGGVFYTGIALYDQNGLVTPTWHNFVQGSLNPSCSFSVTTTTTTDSLFHNPPPPPPPPPLNITLTGPSSVRSGATCLWTATPTNGVPPYGYSWYVNQFPSGNSSDLIYQNGGSSFTVYVDVHDAAGASGSNLKSVTISPSAPVCHF